MAVGMNRYKMTLDHLGLAVVCVAPANPAILFEGASVSFYQVAGMGLIEIREPITQGQHRL